MEFELLLDSSLLTVRTWILLRKLFPRSNPSNNTVYLSTTSAGTLVSMPFITVTPCRGLHWFLYLAAAIYILTALHVVTPRSP